MSEALDTSELVVRGAGVSMLNGTYKWGGLENGKPRWHKSGCWIYWQDGPCHVWSQEPKCHKSAGQWTMHGAYKHSLDTATPPRTHGYFPPSILGAENP